MTAPKYPASALARKLQRCGLPVPPEVRRAEAYERSLRRRTGRPTGRPITSTHPRAKYWREYKRKTI